MRTLICGSMAFDTIMVFHDRFKHHILPDQIHILNVAFLVPELRREFGGCAGNIAYNLKRLGGEPVIMATVGDDFGPYAERLDGLGIGREHVRAVPGSYTAQAFITTDLDDNQITAFHPGAMNHAHENRVADAAGIKLGIVAPDGRQGMLDHARQFHEAGIPFIFDPGQGLPMFSGVELQQFVELADYVAVNDYEAELLQERTGRKLEVLADQVKALVVTLGAQGSRIYAGGKVHDIPPARPHAIMDPTGCGDAYRAGLMFGMLSGYDWDTAGRLAGLLGSVKIASRGGQNHSFDFAEISDRFKAEYGYSL
ncbi:carbohydrate kinase family protein [Parasulfuritortus cantonensis]|uniref:Carbohydrate kinase family protein n=1 Tax=Parasulfuritortus cantonensis TaxID=2528202 RepID=A0A4V2NVV1_9PROT|nr:carbohydrate kinase family protein [Parasulfuritortus cantonensis]TCJ14932.1 carbohydrate kinase family protein [Parasulfuritortus cantonensis]